MKKINNFREQYDFLSNFYQCDVLYEGITYPSAETAFQAAKCADTKERLKFKLLQPGEAKKLGKKINLRPDWENVKVDIMRKIIKIKFSGNQELTNKLLKTGNAVLVESNTWHDNFWGSCECSRCNYISAENMLGNLLMECRTEIQAKNESGRYFNGFSCLSRQDYGAEYIEKITKPKEYTDEILFGVYDKKGGCKSEAAVRWVMITDKQSLPRFEIFIDGYKIFHYLIHLPIFNDFIEKNLVFTPDDFSRLLIKAGFIDLSDEKLAGGNEQ